MTPLEAMRRIATDGPPLIEDAWCRGCQRVVQSFGVNPVTPGGPHADFCAWLVVPEIIAALEELESIKARESTVCE